MKYFRLNNKEMPWGEYGKILFAGHNFYNIKTGQYEVWRTAPFVPSISRTFPKGLLFVTDSMKQEIEKSGLRGLTFQLAVKKRIVLFEWEKWDLSASEPKVYPSGDMDAEEYITRRKHSEQLSEEIGDIWAAIPTTQGYEIGHRDFSAVPEIALVAHTLGNADIFTPSFSYGYSMQERIYVSEKAKDWFLQNGNGDVCFDNAPILIFEVSEQELNVIQSDAEQERIRKEKESAMTKADWSKWHRLIREAEKLSKERHDAKSENVRNRRTANAIAKLNEADKLYPIRPSYEKLIDELQN